MGNVTENRINNSISAPDLAAITSGFNAVNSALDSYSHSLTEQERKKMKSTNVANDVFSNNALEQGEALYSSLAVGVQKVVDNLETDNLIFEQLDNIEKTLLLPLLVRIRDTKRLAAHERYNGALAIYKSIEIGASIGLEGYQAAYDVLKKRFEGQASKKEETEI